MDWIPGNKEEKILARGLKAPGVLLLVKRSLQGISFGFLRVIVSYREAADELVEYFETRGAETEIDVAGDDFHVIIDMKRFKDVD